MRLATDEEGLSKEVSMALSQEMLDDVDSGRSARFIDVTSDGAPPAEAVLIRAMEPSQDQPEAVPEEPEPAESPSDPPPEPSASPSGILADGDAGESPGTVAIAPAEASGSPRACDLVTSPRPPLQLSLPGRDLGCLHRQRPPQSLSGK